MADLGLGLMSAPAAAPANTNSPAPSLADLYNQLALRTVYERNTRNMLRQLAQNLQRAGQQNLIPLALLQDMNAVN